MKEVEMVCNGTVRRDSGPGFGPSMYFEHNEVCLLYENLLKRAYPHCYAFSSEDQQVTCGQVHYGLSVTYI
jgi:hypothetical protein